MLKRFYGVTPWRKTYAEEYFRCPVKKTDVLIMGADDSSIDLKGEIRLERQLEENIHFTDEDFVIITVGK